MKSLIGIICILGMIGAVIGIEVLAGTDTFNATVSPQNISVIVEDGAVAYGVLNLSAEQDTVTLGDEQDAGNNGNVYANFDIKSGDATGGTQWDLGADTDANDQFVHKYSTTGSSPYVWRTFVDNATYDDLAQGVSTTASQSFDLYIGVPVTSTDYQQKTIQVTILAVDSAT